MSYFQEQLRDALAQRENDGLRRCLRAIPPRVLDLASNDYLGLSNDARVVEAACEAARTFGTGARASRLVSGNLPIHQQLESEIARFKICESALLFSSGYAANIGVIAALARNGDTVLCDKRNHASLVDACKTAQSNGANVRYYSNIEKLRALLQSNAPVSNAPRPKIQDPKPRTSSTRSAQTRVLVVTDGVFSMDGDVCDLPQLFSLCREFEAVLILDEAHATGTLGTSGRGTIEHFGLDKSEIEIVEIGTLSKALGAQGGFVVGSQTLIDFLTNAARPFVYSTALSPMTCGAALQSLRVLEDEPQLLQRLRDVTRQLANGLKKIGFEARLQPSPIISVLIGDTTRALEVSQSLLELGIWCPAIRPPTVPNGTSRLRVTASATLSHADIARALTAFTKAKRVLE